jgi:hypothetical protein
MPARSSNLDPAFERALRDVLYDRKLPCPHCRYDLRGLVGAICPECGHNVELHLRVADLSPARIRREKIENTVRTAAKVLGFLLLLAPLAAIVLLFVMTK